MGFSIFKKKGDEIDEVEAAVVEQEIDTSPQSEEPQKINKGILYLVIFLIAVVMGYALLSGGNKKQDNTEESAAVTQQELLPAETLAEIERKERENRGQGKDKPMGDPSGSNRQPPQPPNTKIEAGGYPQQNMQPQPIVPSTPQVSEAEIRQREKAEKREDEREKEQREGQRSGIFFTLSKDKDKKEHKTTQAERINDYYNNQGYIEIVGGETR